MKERDFKRFWLGIMLSRIGDAFTSIALSWFVLKIAGPAEVGIVLLCFGLPMLVSGPIVGSLLDHYQPRTIMGIDNVGRAILMASIPLSYWLGILSLWYIYIIGLLVGFLSAATVIGESTVTPKLVPDDVLESANTLLSMNWQIAALIGPTIAGLLVGLIGAPATILVDAFSFLCMGLVAFSLPIIVHNHPSLPNKNTFFKESIAGFKTLVHMQSVCLITVITSIALFTHGITEVLIPTYSQNVLKVDALGYGLLVSSTGVGSLIGILLLGSRLRKFRPGVSLAMLLILDGLLFFPLFLIRALMPAILLMFVMSFISSPYYMLNRTIMQRLVPEHLRGRIFGVTGAIRSGSFPVGAAIGGVLLAHFSPPLVIIMIGAIELTLGIATLCSPILYAIPNPSQLQKNIK